MPRATSKDSSEKLQIIILTFAMTGGAFALVTLLLVFWFNPSAEQRAQALEAEYKDLTQLLLKQEMRDLRANAKMSEGQENNRPIGEIVMDSLQKFELEPRTFPQARTKTSKSGLEEVTQKIDVKPARLANLLQFVASVKDARKTIQVETISINRDTRAKGDDDSWTATVDFVDYVTKK
jgi:type II secretory pathway component PulM